MKKLKRKDEVTIIVKTGSSKDFFSRGKRIAKLLDKKKQIPTIRIISFEDPADLVAFLTKTKLTLLTTLRKKPDSITKLALKLHRSRAAVDKDIRLLESVGIVESEYVSNPGHGRCRIVRATDLNPIKLQVEAII
jgi:predicted transcriptional regulator